MREIVDWLRAAPEGTLVPADAIARCLASDGGFEALSEAPRPIVPHEESSSLLDRFWGLPPDTRLDVAKLREAIGKPASWIYRRTSLKSELPKLPHKRIGSRLVFVVGEVQQYLKQHEVTVVAPAFTVTDKQFPFRSK